MLLAESVHPFTFTGIPAALDKAFNTKDVHQRSYSTTSKYRQRQHARSMSSISSASPTAPLRLADVARQHCMAVHVENWREDTAPVRQLLPMQPIIGSLKRDRDEKVQYPRRDTATAFRTNLFKQEPEVAAASPRSEDSFLHELRTPKKRRTSGCSAAGSNCTTDSDPDRRFSYQASEHTPKDISQAALPGLNHILNLATITAVERDIFSEYAPKHLEDPQILMTEVLQLRTQMMNDEEDNEDDEDMPADLEESASTIGSGSPIISPERDAEVRKAFENFVDLSGNDRFIAKT